MRKSLWMSMALMLVIPGLLFTVSCGKKAVSSGTSMSASGDSGEAMSEEEMAKRRAMEEAALAEKRKKEMAMQRFVNEDVFFEFDSSALGMMAQEVLRRKAEWLRDNPDRNVLIEGHCDERGTPEYNLALGERRAESAKQFLRDLGISSSRLSTISFGEERPVDPRSNEEAWAKNRRAHFVLR